MSNARKGTISVKKDLLRPGVSIKQEPGVEIQIKQEPGTGILKPSPDATVPGRLSSFKLPRDLTLGGQNTRKAPKKVYTPNLNAIRVKKDSPTAQEPIRGTGRGRGRGRGQNERGRGRGRQNTNLVQSAGIFSEGSADILRRGSAFSGSYAKDDSANLLQKPTLNLKQELKVDITEEGEHLKALLGDFDNSIKSPNNIIETNPIVLSASKHDVISKGKLASQVPLAKIKQEPGIVVKTEIEDTNDGLVPEIAVKSLDENVQEETEVYNKVLSLPGLLSMQNSPFFLLQLPDTLPGQGSEELIEPEASKEESSKSTTKTPAKCTLKDLDSGFIGKIVMYKSGKSKLVLGQTFFDLELGSQTSFLQDLISIDVNTTQRSGSMINLGQVQSKVIASPDWNLLTSKQS